MYCHDAGVSFMTSSTLIPVTLAINSHDRPSASIRRAFRRRSVRRPFFNPFSIPSILSTKIDDITQYSVYQ